MIIILARFCGSEKMDIKPKPPYTLQPGEQFDWIRETFVFTGGPAAIVVHPDKDPRMLYADGHFEPIYPAALPDARAWAKSFR